MNNRVNSLVLRIAIMLAVGVSTYAQQGAPVAPPVATPNAGQSSDPRPTAAPQVSPIIHRLSGLKLLTLMRRNGVKVAPLSDEMLTSNAVQTNIAAGLWLEDGSIVTRLPRAELELSEASEAAPIDGPGASNSSEAHANLFVIQPDGRAIPLQFIGLDGGTGLSLLRVVGQIVATPYSDAREDNLAVGQRIRLMSPARAPQADGLTSTEVFVSMTEVEGSLSFVSRSPAGSITRLTVLADKLSSSSVGGVAVNDLGETIGLVEASSGTEAQLIPIAGVRRAAARILSRLENKPQPWLGARGISIATVSREQLELAGWKGNQAIALLKKQIGVVLTSIPPQTPAWQASLRVGDVVTRINGDEVRSADDFSSLLAQAGTRKPVRFTVFRPDRSMPRVVTVKLNFALSPVLEVEAAEDRAAQLKSTDPLVARGIETFPITQSLATRLNARGGLLVVYVHPSSAASRAGVQAGDVIESIDNELFDEGNLPVSLPSTINLNIVRNRQKLALQVDMEAAVLTPAQIP